MRNALLLSALLSSTAAASVPPDKVRPVLPKDGAAVWPEIKAFPRDMWGSFKQQGRVESVYILLAAAGGASIARFGEQTYFDDYFVADTLRRHRPLGPEAVEFGAVIGHSMYLLPAMAGTYFAGAYLEHGSMREFGLIGFEALALAGMQTLALKYSVHRLRPDKTDYAAFPSGHSSASFALATVAGSRWGWKVGVPAGALASFVAYTRMEGQSHYLSDVVFGAGLGIVSGRAVFQQHRKDRPGKYAFAPFVTPGGGGVRMTF